MRGKSGLSGLSTAVRLRLFELGGSMPSSTGEAAVHGGDDKMTGRKYARRVEYWRSRIAPREVVYWRYVNHNGQRYTPDCGKPGDLALLILKARAEYGAPQRTVRPGVGGPIVVLTFRTDRRDFRFRPGAWTYCRE